MEGTDLLNGRGEKLLVSKFVDIREHVYILKEFCWNITLPVGK